MGSRYALKPLVGVSCQFGIERDFPIMQGLLQGLWINICAFYPILQKAICPPSSWPIGMRFNEVTKSPIHPAKAT